jgi:hypothetical protein
MAANAALIALLALGVFGMSKETANSGPHDAHIIGWAAATLVGPFIATAAGWIIGAALAVVLYLRRRVVLPPNISLERR